MTVAITTARAAMTTHTFSRYSLLERLGLESNVRAAYTTWA